MLRPGTVLEGRYELRGKIGRGGMSAVYAAFDTRLGVEVAIKQTHRGTASGPALTREARILATLRHPGLPVVIDYFADAESLFLVMELFPGDDLAKMLAARGAPFPAPVVLRWAGQILDALIYLHGRRPPVIHRDIKPHNLKLTREGSLVLLDFGLAKSSNASLNGFTPRYASPEQIEQSGTDPRSDLFSLGATLYHLLVGRQPPTALERLDARLKRLADPLDLDALPVAVEALAATLALDPAERPASAQELASMLRAVTGEQRSSLRPAAVATGGSRTTIVLEPRGHNLPAQMTPLVGRATDATAVARMLRDGPSRLVSLTGPPGVGKTHLACEVARLTLGDPFEHSCFVSLDDLREPRELLAAICMAVGMSAATSARALAAYLSPRPTLLVLDPFEQLLSAGVDLLALLGAAPQLRLLVTSRASLRVRAEQEYTLAPLAAPPTGQPLDPAELMIYPAIELFVHRARAARHGFALTAENAVAVAAICASLDGLPLALVLAAARMRALAPAAFQSRLARRLELLVGGPRDLAPRSRSMRDSITASFTLLGHDEQLALGAAAVFPGPFTLEAAEPVFAAVVGAAPATLDLVEGLAAHHLLSYSAPDGQAPTFRMLGVIRDFGLEWLARTGRAAAARAAHAANGAGRVAERGTDTAT